LREKGAIPDPRCIVMSAPLLLTNPLSFYWRKRNLDGHPKRQRWIYVTYLGGMLGYSLCLVKRACEIAYCVLRLAASFFFLLACQPKRCASELYKWTMGTFGAVAWLGCGVIGTLCPPLAYLLDEQLYRHPVLRETLWTSIWQSRKNQETLAKWDLPTTRQCFTEAINKAEIAEKDDRSLHKLRILGLFLAMRYRLGRNELLLYDINVSKLHQRYLDVRETPSYWAQLTRDPKYTDEELFRSLDRLIDGYGGGEEPAEQLYQELKTLSASLIEQKAADSALINAAFNDAIPYPLDDLKEHIADLRERAVVLDRDKGLRIVLGLMLDGLPHTFRVHEGSLKQPLAEARKAYLAAGMSKGRLMSIYIQGSSPNQAETNLIDKLNRLANDYLYYNERIFNTQFYTHPFGEIHQHMTRAGVIALNENNFESPSEDVIYALALYILIEKLEPPYKVKEAYKNLLVTAAAQKPHLSEAKVAKILLGKREAKPREVAFFATLAELKETMKQQEGSALKSKCQEILGGENLTPRGRGGKRH